MGQRPQNGTLTERLPTLGSGAHLLRFARRRGIAMPPSNQNTTL